MSMTAHEIVSKTKSPRDFWFPKLFSLLSIRSYFKARYFKKYIDTEAQILQRNLDIQRELRFRPSLGRLSVAESIMAKSIGLGAFLFLNWRKIALQCYIGFFCTTTWVSHASAPSWASLPSIHAARLGRHRAPSWAPCVIQKLLTSHLFDTW